MMFKQILRLSYKHVFLKYVMWIKALWYPAQYPAGCIFGKISKWCWWCIDLILLYKRTLRLFYENTHNVTFCIFLYNIPANVHKYFVKDHDKPFVSFSFLSTMIRNWMALTTQMIKLLTITNFKQIYHYSINQWP